MAAGGKSVFASLLLHGAVVIGAAGWAIHSPGSTPAETAGDGDAGVPLFLDRDASAELPAAPELEPSDLAEYEPPEPTTAEFSKPVAKTMPAEQPPMSMATVPAPVAPGGAPEVIAMPAAQSRTPSVRAKTSSRSSRKGSVGAGDGSYTPAQYLRCPAPAFPSAAKRGRISGTVLIFVLVDEKGRPTDVSVRRSSGHEVLDQVAIAAVRRWRFEPARMNGETVSAKLEVPVRFAL